MMQMLVTFYISSWTSKKFTEQQDSKYPINYAIILVCYFLATFARSFVNTLIMLFSTTNLHKAVLTHVIRSRIVFFDQNPLGRIMTRFSKEITTLDLILPPLFNGITFTGFRSLTIFFMICYIFPYMLILVAIVGIGMWFILNKALKGLGECLRADGVYKGPIHDDLATIVNGLVTLRKYERNGFFKANFINNLEKSTNVVFSYYLVNRFMALHLDLACLVFSTGASCFAIYMRKEEDPEVLAFALQLLTELVMFFSITLRYQAEVESYFMSANRLHRYTQLEIEDELDKPGDKD
jgi:ATP-binding cassette, subfamily C (CFTR/MRP), member 2